MNDEKMKILQMIADGKITPEEGADLLRALEVEEVEVPTGKARWLIIRVYEPGADNPRVNLRLPMGMAGKLLKFADRFTKDVDIRDVYDAIQSGETGLILEVDGDDGERVEIWLEN